MKLKWVFDNCLIINNKIDIIDSGKLIDQKSVFFVLLICELTMMLLL